MMVDTRGLLIVVVVTAASVQDRHGVRWLLERLYDVGSFYPRLKTFLADQGYQGPVLGDWFKTMFGKIGWVLQIVKSVVGRGFEVIPKRWIVERTFAWLYNFRRLARD
jgi:putative transposase